ncbi:unnamed protein product [Spirodela intermedia]|uniref:Uncharacterized protein n=1 Tax=Spirodela intermedia TaxID=51605 RepID=A0ABN7E7W1_SPIIN|nr:unnamed protein product [Spirodela intermedia]
MTDGQSLPFVGVSETRYQNLRRPASVNSFVRPFTAWT